MNIEPKRNQNRNRFEIDSEILPHFINHAEWDLDTTISSATELNFVVYVPPYSSSPLRITQDGKLLKTNGFVVPRWGGLYIHNLPPLEIVENTTNMDIGNRFLNQTDLEPIFQSFVGYLRALLAVEELKPVLNEKYNLKIIPSTAAVSKWELDCLLRRRLIENSLNSIKTLVSLKNLISKIANVVVKDRVITRVKNALSYIEKSYSLITQTNQSTYLLASFLASSKALVDSEAAFFDPTMIAMLYFPDEHLFAVYAPLFFPIGFPVLVSFIKTFIKPDK